MSQQGDIHGHSRALEGSADYGFGAFVRTPNGLERDLAELGPSPGHDRYARDDRQLARLYACEHERRFDAHGARGPFGEYDLRRSQALSARSSFWERVKGALRGKPANHMRPDPRIQEDVADRLSYDPALDASAVDVLVEHGEVTLSGLVDDRRAKRVAEIAAEGIVGVKAIHNHLRVRRLPG
jgi:BON domain-containing protein